MEPTVCAVCLTADRQEMTDRAVRSFLAQDYPRKSLLIVDTGVKPYPNALAQDGVALRRLKSEQVKKAGLTIGGLRNLAARFTYGEATPWYYDAPDILTHFDSDDWSAPTRISDQVKLLVESGKQAVGYREMLFWREPREPETRAEARICTEEILPGEAWLYSNTDPSYCLATSLCYWRKTWEAKPFPDAMIGSEREWLKGLDVLGVPSVVWRHPDGGPTTLPSYSGSDPPQPAMLATIHGGNTVKNQISTVATNPDGSPMWKRVPAWDQRVKSDIQQGPDAEPEDPASVVFAQPESKFTPGQLVRFTDAGMAKYRGNPRDEMVFERDGAINDAPGYTRYALVRYSDGDEAVYEEEFLEAV